MVMDTREAVKALDAYSDGLVGLSALVGAAVLQNTPGQEMQLIHQGLQLKLEEKRQDALQLALEIITHDKQRAADWDDPLADLVGLNAAVQRYVDADHQANEALKPPRESFAAGMVRIMKEKDEADRVAGLAASGEPALAASGDPATGVP